jgi:hypothetical protein
MIRCDYCKQYDCEEPRAKCRECDRVFDLANAADAEEWAYGHDCEEA